MPPYWIWLLAVAIPFTFLYVPEIALSLLQSKKLKQAILLLPSDSFQEWITQAWTLSYELAFYGIFGLFILLPKVLGKGLLIAWACAVVALSIIPHRPFAPWLDHLIGPFVCEFLLGILVARIAHSASRFHPAVYLSVGCVWLTASFLGTYFSVQSPIGIHPKLRVLVFGIPSMWLLLAAVVLEKRGYAIKTPLLQEMGNASYSLYLTHGTVLKIIYLLSAYTVFPQSPWTHIGWLMTMFLLSVAMGWGYYRWVERPLLKWGRRQFRRNEPQREFRGIASAITAAARPSA
jgi:peptidoglycan/LPS O-acetylase OafA/YrhL